ncbi:fatty-acyl-CoA synthase [Nocardia farcinica]|uniref:4-chlorobenzoate--CoA ligase n=2 Tax=Nocardia farcinica TaxID=37329 RepID=A0A0H5PLI4_NOCFR|nr:Long-chain-fatty-acid--CoA ligase [Nocardia farcinica]PFX07461.1 Long-chain-fatty-acid--CoA ligase [Nocardia farcinica]CRY83331.1 4-chlorobenzoate--CoA ligase [Nocardia farcinica]SIT19177.1 fatty-acyl-CoA synthase [Nocardia farcinica]SUE26747.1 acyl-CoA ligase [Nocardia farcinica]
MVNLAHALETIKALGVLRSSGVVDLSDPGETLRNMRETRQYGPHAALVRHSARVAPDHPALVDERGELTYKELDEQSTAVARGLQAAGITEGMVIAALARDHRGLIMAKVAAGKLGVRIALMNTGFAKPQFAEVCAREKVQAVLHDSEFLGLLDALPPELPRYLTWVDEGTEVPAGTQTFDDLIAANSTEPLPAPSKPGGFIILTSGTTGLPKGAPRTKVSPFATAQFVDRMPFRRFGTMVIVSPIFHSTGLGTWLVGTVLSNKIVMRRRFDAEATLKMIADHKANMLVAVPTMLHRMVELPEEVRAKYDLSSLESIVLAGSALSPELSIRAAEVFGPVVYNLYGSTEVAIATIAKPEELAVAPGTVGRPPITCDVRLYDDNDKQIHEKNVTGRIFVRSGAPFEGYTDGRHKQIIDGYMSSGDVGHFEEHGLLMVDGRDDDMIVSGGENVYPQEVENLLLEHDDIFDAAVVGVDDVEFGKRLRAFVVPEPGKQPDAEEIKAYVKNNLARYKVPREVVFLDDLPRNATGKLLRRVLVDYDVKA